MAALILAGALALAVDGPVLVTAALTVAMRHPLVAAVGVGTLVLWARSRIQRPTPDQEAGFLRSISTELRAGSSPRAAVITAASGSPEIDAERLVRASRLGLDTRSLAGELRRCLPLNGRLAGAAYTVAGDSGASLSSVIEMLAVRAAVRGRLERERRVSSAQARATAWIISGIPAAVLAGLVVTGRLHSPGSTPVVIVGVALQAVGLAVVVLMLRGRA